MIRRLAVLAAVTIVAALAVSVPITLARFAASRPSTATFGTGSLRPPTSVTGTGGSSASLAWTASTSTSATGYNLLRSATSGSGYAQVGTVTPVSATSATDGPGAGTWYYVLTTYLGNWASAASNEASVTVGPATTTPLVGCTTQAAETVNAGDNNGYEGDPTLGCVKDSKPAVDASSGTNTNLACADPGKDRERFWGYTFGLPGTVSSISGVTVSLVEGLNNNSGTSQVCAQLSWDGGTSWTTPKIANIANVPFQTYTLGSSTDTWGHAGWTSTQLNTSNFRVRLTDMSNVATKDFQLDFLGVSVSYTP